MLYVITSTTNLLCETFEMRRYGSLQSALCFLCYFHDRFDEAAVALKRELDYYSQIDNNGLLNKLVMGLVLVQLHRGDYVAADQSFKGTLKSVCRFSSF